MVFFFDKIQNNKQEANSIIGMNEKAFILDSRFIISNQIGLGSNIKVVILNLVSVHNLLTIKCNLNS
ncbi:MAG: hypothetical protein ACOYO1_19395 [Bacteroidales bacterium]